MGGWKVPVDLAPFFAFFGVRPQNGGTAALGPQNGGIAAFRAQKRGLPKKMEPKWSPKKEKGTTKTRKMTVDPLSLGSTPERDFRKMFRASVLETVTSPTPIEVAGSVLKWSAAQGWALDAAQKTLRSAPESVKSETWGLAEVTYVLSDDNTLVAFVVLTFVRERRYLAVRVSSATFRAHLQDCARAVLTSTIDSSREVGEGKKPDRVAADFPGLALGFASAVTGARANTPIAGFTNHVAGGVLYMPIGKHKYLGARPAVAPDTLVLEGTRETDFLKPHDTLLEETAVTAVTEAAAEPKAPGGPSAPSAPSAGPSAPAACFASPRLKLCRTGKMLYGSAEYDLAEVLYVADEAEWACVLHFRGAQRPFAVRLGYASALLFLSWSKPLDVLTSTTIRAATLLRWPNAHGQGTTDAPVTRAIAPEHAGLMLDTRARMVYVPASGTTPSVVLRYEPLPTCADSLDTRRWSVWDLCAADATGRAPSEACAVFAPCAKGAEVARLANVERDPVPLYAAPETGVLYGATSAASYLVKPNGAAATVIVASIGRSDVREATLDGKVWTCGSPEPPCKRLVACMEGAELAACKAHADTCAWTDDRSQLATRLEHEGVAVGMRQLDARTYYGVDERGAFAMRAGNVLFVPGVKRPTWPRLTTDGNPDEAQVLKAGYDSEKRAWVVGETAPGDPSKAKEFPWKTLWLVIGAVVGAIFLFGLSAFLRAVLR